MFNIKVTWSIIKWTFLTSAIVFIFYQFSELVKVSREDLPSVYNLSKVDSTVFSDNAMDKINVIEIHRSRLTNSFSELMYDSFFYLVLAKVNFDSSISLSKNIKIEQSSPGQTDLVPYTVIDRGFRVKFKQRAAALGPIEDLYITFNGDEKIKWSYFDDSIVSILVSTEKATIRLSEKGPVDFILEGKDAFLGSTEYPLLLTLVRKATFVYVVFAIPIHENRDITPILFKEIFVEG